MRDLISGPANAGFVYVFAKRELLRQCRRRHMAGFWRYRLRVRCNTVIGAAIPHTGFGVCPGEIRLKPPVAVKANPEKRHAFDPVFPKPSNARGGQPERN